MNVRHVLLSMYSFRESFDVKILAWAKGQRFGWKMLLAVRIKLIGLGRRPTKISGPWCMVYSRFSGVDCPSPLHLQLISLPSEESLYSHPFLFSMINSLHKTKVIHHSKHEALILFCHTAGFTATSLSWSWMFSYEEEMEEGGRSI